MVETALSKPARRAKPPSPALLAMHCGARLEKIIFPRIVLERAMDEEEVAKPLKRSSIELNVKGSLTTQDHPTNGHAYVVASMHFDAKATSQETGEIMVGVGLTCAGYFRCSSGLTLDELTEYVTANTDAVSVAWTMQIYSAAVLEFERLLSLAGLPSMKLSMSPPLPGMEQESESVSLTTAKPVRKKAKPRQK